MARSTELLPNASPLPVDWDVYFYGSPLGITPLVPLFRYSQHEAPSRIGSTGHRRQQSFRARITGQLAHTQFDGGLQEWQQAGLRLASVVWLHKLATLDKQLVERSLGNLSEIDLQQVQATLQRLLQAINP